MSEKPKPEETEPLPEVSEETKSVDEKAEPAKDNGGEAAPKDPKDPKDPKGYYNQLLLLKAEFENFRKRTDKEKREFVRYGSASVLMKLLPIYDLLQAAHREVQASHNDTPLGKGMEGIFKEFEKLFKDEGIVPMDPVGKPYHTMHHEVLGTVETEESPEDSVVDVLQNGYLIGDKVLRTAKVRIAKKPQSKNKTGEGDKTQ